MSTHNLTLDTIETLIARRRFASAIATLSGWVAHDPASARAWSLLGQAYTESGHQQAALTALDRALLLDEESAETLEAMGVTLLRMRRTQQAREWFHRGLKTVRDAGRRASLLRNLAISLIMDERNDEARFVLEEALDYGPRDVLSLHALAAQYLNSNRYSEARELLDRILAEPRAPKWLRDTTEERISLIPTGE